MKESFVSDSARKYGLKRAYLNFIVRRVDVFVLGLFVGVLRFVDEHKV